MNRRRSSCRQMQVQLEELNFSMYGEARDDELRGVSTIISQGRFCFSAVHDVDNQCLIVNVLRAQCINLDTLQRSKLRKSSGNCQELDTSISVSIFPNLGHKSFVTSICLNDTDPTWQESFCFNVDKRMAKIAFLKFTIQYHEK